MTCPVRVYLLLALVLQVSAADNQTVPDAPATGDGLDLGVPLGIAKGIANGDFFRNWMESIGMRQRTANGTMAEIPWPRQGTEFINQVEQNLSTILSQLQQMLRQAVNRNKNRGPRERKL